MNRKQMYASAEYVVCIAFNAVAAFQSPFCSFPFTHLTRGLTGLFDTCMWLQKLDAVEQLGVHCKS